MPSKQYLLALAAFAAAALAPAGSAIAKQARLSDVRAATAGFHRVAAAKADGRDVLKDAAGIACIDNPGVGGMGIHYVNGGLVAVEYVVFKDAWDKAHSRRPSLFGHRFDEVEAGNRYGLPAFYELHVWAWKSNPAGTFADMNMEVSCDAAKPGGQ